MLCTLKNNKKKESYAHKLSFGSPDFIYEKIQIKKPKLGGVSEWYNSESI